MSTLVSWPRTHYVESGGRPLLAYYVFGRFGELAPSRSKHRVGGVPQGLAITGEATAIVRHLFDAPVFSDGLAADPVVDAAVRASPTVLIVQGELDDADTLDYLRDTLGIVAAALDAGGVGVLDLQTFAWWSPDAFRSQFFDSPGPNASAHVAMLGSPEDGGTTWLHTRGLRKFGRPDLSVHGVTAATKAPYLDLLGRFVSLQAMGGVIPDGQTVKMPSLPVGLTCHHGGHVDDPEFNNVHVEVRGPARNGVTERS